jgi:hypothetical protein
MPQPEQFYRYGLALEAAESLEALCETAVERGFPHGVSVRSEKSRHDACVASRAELELYFRVGQTGRSPLHFTVELPHPVTREIAERFNAIFGRENRTTDG